MSQENVSSQDFSEDTQGIKIHQKELVKTWAKKINENSSNFPEQLKELLNGYLIALNDLKSPPDFSVAAENWKNQVFSFLDNPKQYIPQDNTESQKSGRKNRFSIFSRDKQKKAAAVKPTVVDSPTYTLEATCQQLKIQLKQAYEAYQQAYKAYQKEIEEIKETEEINAAGNYEVPETLVSANRKNTAKKTTRKKKSKPAIIAEPGPQTSVNNPFIKTSSPSTRVVTEISRAMEDVVGSVRKDLVGPVADYVEQARKGGEDENARQKQEYIKKAEQKISEFTAEMQKISQNSNPTEDCLDKTTKITSHLIFLNDQMQLLTELDFSKESSLVQFEQIKSNINELCRPSDNIATSDSSAVIAEVPEGVLPQPEAVTQRLELPESNQVDPQLSLKQKIQAKIIQLVDYKNYQLFAQFNTLKQQMSVYLNGDVVDKIIAAELERLDKNIADAVVTLGKLVSELPNKEAEETVNQQFSTWDNDIVSEFINLHLNNLKNIKTKTQAKFSQLDQYKTHQKFVEFQEKINCMQSYTAQFSQAAQLADQYQANIENEISVKKEYLAQNPLAVLAPTLDNVDEVAACIQKNSVMVEAINAELAARTAQCKQIDLVYVEFNNQITIMQQYAAQGFIHVAELANNYKVAVDEKVAVHNTASQQISVVNKVVTPATISPPIQEKDTANTNALTSVETQREGAGSISAKLNSAYSTVSNLVKKTIGNNEQAAVAPSEENTQKEIDEFMREKTSEKNVPSIEQVVVLDVKALYQETLNIINEKTAEIQKINDELSKRKTTIAQLDQDLKYLNQELDFLNKYDCTNNKRYKILTEKHNVFWDKTFAGINKSYDKQQALASVNSFKEEQRKQIALQIQEKESLKQEVLNLWFTDSSNTTYKSIADKVLNSRRPQKFNADHEQPIVQFIEKLITDEHQAYNAQLKIYEDKVAELEQQIKTKSDAIEKKTEQFNEVTKQIAQQKQKVLDTIQKAEDTALNAIENHYVRNKVSLAVISSSQNTLSDEELAKTRLEKLPLIGGLFMKINNYSQRLEKVKKYKQIYNFNSQTFKSTLKNLKDSGAADRVVLDNTLFPRECSVSNLITQLKTSFTQKEAHEQAKKTLEDQKTVLEAQKEGLEVFLTETVRGYAPSQLTASSSDGDEPTRKKRETSEEGARFRPPLSGK